VADLIRCVNSAVQKGYITKAEADDIKDFYKNELKSGKADNAATAENAIKKMQYEKIRTKQLAVRTAHTRTRLMDYVKSHPEGLNEGLKSLITKNITQGAGYSNVQYRAAAINDLIRIDLVDAFDALREQWGTGWWTRDKQLSADIIKEIMGEESGNTTAKKVAKKGAKTNEEARLQFNAAGGDIPKLSNWGMPQGHNRYKVGKAGLKAWKKEIRDKLDTKAMGLENDAEGLENLLDYVFESISTNGANKKEPGKLPKGKSRSSAKSEKQHRILHFKDADSLMA